MTDEAAVQEERTLEDVRAEREFTQELIDTAPLTGTPLDELIQPLVSELSAKVLELRDEESRLGGELFTAEGEFVRAHDEILEKVMSEVLKGINLMDTLPEDVSDKELALACAESADIAIGALEKTVKALTVTRNAVASGALVFVRDQSEVSPPADL